jgi:HlyD family secretion protein
MINAFRKSPLVNTALLPALLLAVGCQGQSTPAAKKAVKTAAPAKVSVGIVRTQLLEKIISLPATIESDQTALLMPRVEAYVDEVLVDIGDEVSAGQVLVRLSAPELVQAVQEQQAMQQQIMADGQVLQAQLAAAQTQLEVGNAELDLKNSERSRLATLASSGSIERQRLEEANSAARSSKAMLQKYAQAMLVIEAKLKKGESELAVGQAQLERAETLAGYLEIKAPFAGVVAERNVDPGNLVRPSGSGTDMRSLLRVAKVDKLRAVLHATTDIARQLAIGCPVEFVTDDITEKTFTGQLSRFAGTYHQKTRMMRAEVDLDNSLDPLTGRRPLRAGSYGTTSFVLQSQTLPVVPTTALRRQGDQQSVVVVREGVCMITPVDVAFEVGDLTGIANGLQAGDQVVVKDADKIRNEQALSEAERQIILW